MWAALGGFLGGLFGGGNTAQKITDVASKAVDVANGNEQMIISAKTKAVDAFTRLMLAMAPQEIARRLLALSIVYFYLFWCFVALAAWPFDPTYSEFIFKFLKDNLATSLSVVIAFYFVKNITENFMRK